jgi:hypothetical protein
MVLYLIMAPLPHGSWMRSTLANQLHGAEALPHATMLQAADSCAGGHFLGDESHGYWVQDFQLILRGPSADSIFSTLSRQRQPMARLYGLIGLSVTNPVLFEHMASTYQLPDTAILVADSCRAVQQPLKT